MNFYHHVGGILMPISRLTRWRIFMRVQLILISIFLLLAQLQATDLKAQRVTLHVKGQNLQQVLKEVRKQTGYDFVYSPETLKANAQPVTIAASNTPVADLLEQLFAAQSRLQHTVDQNTVIVRVKKEPNPIGTIEMRRYQDAETKDWIIEGIVLDEETKEPIEGVTVELNERGVKLQTQSDTQGRFRLVIPKR
jgi:type II secretory pathway component GspD/PulD (secretin)